MAEKRVTRSVARKSMDRASCTFQIGDRVQVTGRTGTLRYVGSPDFAPGEWAGVELDTPDGKNNGTVKGKTYFETAPNHGIFVPSGQLKSARSKGSSTPKLTAATERTSNSSNSTPSRLDELRQRKDKVASQLRNRMSIESASSKGRTSLGRISTGRQSTGSTGIPFARRGRTSGRSTTKPEGSTQNRPVQKKVFTEDNVANSDVDSVVSDDFADSETSMDDSDSESNESQPDQSVGESTKEAKESATESNANEVDISLLSAVPQTNASTRNASEVEFGGSKDAAINAQNDKLKNALLSAHAKIEHLEQQLEVSHHALEAKMQELASLQGTHKKTEARAAKMEQDATDMQLRTPSKQVLKEQVELRSSTAKLSRRLDESRSHTLQLEQKIKEFESVNKQLQEELEKVEEDKLDVELQAATIEEDLENARIEISQLRKELVATKAVASSAAPEDVSDKTPERIVSDLRKQNTELREGLSKLRILSMRETAELKKRLSEAEKQAARANSLAKETEQQKEALQSLRAERLDLLEQLDTSDAYDAIIENLTEKNLLLGDRLDELKAEVAEHEELRNVSEELERHQNEFLESLQHELDETKRELIASESRVTKLSNRLQETVSEADISKTVVSGLQREVSKLQNSLSELQGGEDEAGARKQTLRQLLQHATNVSHASALSLARTNNGAAHIQSAVCGGMSAYQLLSLMLPGNILSAIWSSQSDSFVGLQTIVRSTETLLHTPNTLSSGASVGNAVSLMALLAALEQTIAWNDTAMNSCQVALGRYSADLFDCVGRYHTTYTNYSTDVKDESSLLAAMQELNQWCSAFQRLKLDLIPATVNRLQALTKISTLLRLYRCALMAHRGSLARLTTHLAHSMEVVVELRSSVATYLSCCCQSTHHTDISDTTFTFSSSEALQALVSLHHTYADDFEAQEHRFLADVVYKSEPQTMGSVLATAESPMNGPLGIYTQSNVLLLNHALQISHIYCIAIALRLQELTTVFVQPHALLERGVQYNPTQWVSLKGSVQQSIDDAVSRSRSLIEKTGTAMRQLANSVHQLSDKNMHQSNDHDAVYLIGDWGMNTDLESLNESPDITKNPMTFYQSTETKAQSFNFFSCNLHAISSAIDSSHRKTLRQVLSHAASHSKGTPPSLSPYHILKRNVINDSTSVGSIAMNAAHMVIEMYTDFVSSVGFTALAQSSLTAQLDVDRESVQSSTQTSPSNSLIAEVIRELIHKLQSDTNVAESTSIDQLCGIMEHIKNGSVTHDYESPIAMIEHLSEIDESLLDKSEHTRLARPRITPLLRAFTSIRGQLETASECARSLESARALHAETAEELRQKKEELKELQTRQQILEARQKEMVDREYSYDKKAEQIQSLQLQLESQETDYLAQIEMLQHQIVNLQSQHHDIDTDNTKIASIGSGTQFTFTASVSRLFYALRHERRVANWYKTANVFTKLRALPPLPRLFAACQKIESEHSHSSEDPIETQHSPAKNPIQSANPSRQILLTQIDRLRSISRRQVASLSIPSIDLTSKSQSIIPDKKDSGCSTDWAKRYTRQISSKQTACDYLAASEASAASLLRSLHTLRSSIAQTPLELCHLQQQGVHVNPSMYSNRWIRSASSGIDILLSETTTRDKSHIFPLQTPLGPIPFQQRTTARLW